MLDAPTLSSAGHAMIGRREGMRSKRRSPRSRVAVRATWQVRLRLSILLLVVSALPTGLSILVGDTPARAGTFAVRDTSPAGFDTKVTGTIVTSKGVLLTRDGTGAESRNPVCPGANPVPSSVPEGASASFCYEDKPYFIQPGTSGTGIRGGPTGFSGQFKTAVSFVYTISIPGADGSWVPSGYSVSGHVTTAPATGSPGELQCSVDKTVPDAPPLQFSCLTSTFSGLNEPNLEPRWTVTAGTIPAGEPRVYFLGDSVTAGFGYCGTEGEPLKTCGVNQSFDNDWKGTNSLEACSPPATINDRCSNNNDTGMPWVAGPWFDQPGAPTVAYSYVIAKRQSTVDPAAIENWAVTGSTPADWDPVTNGRFGPQLKKIKNATVVMTLGANPLLSDYLDISVLGLVTIQKGSCADTAVVGHSGLRTVLYRAAEPEAGPGGILNCFDAQWQQIEQTKHLVDIYESLLNDGDHVLVLGYPMGCPWSFGNWQPNANLLSGPATGNPCTSLSHPGEVTPARRVTQWDQAAALTAEANKRIKEALHQAGESTQHVGDIAFAAPSANWSDHQAWSSDPWIFRNDTWVHPNSAGHQQLAQTVMAEMCARFHHWCGDPPRWNS